MTHPLLAIDTTGNLASASLITDDGKIYSDSMKEKLNHLKGLLSLVDGLLKKAGIQISDVKTIAVSQGPGSFTGIRIGITTARSIAQVTGAKLVSVPTLETFVYNNPGYHGIVCPVFDARMKQMYAGAFTLEENKINRFIETGAYDPQDYCNLLTELMDEHFKKHKGRLDFMFFGDGVSVFKPQLVHWSDKMKRKHFFNFSMGFDRVNNLQTAESVRKWAEDFGTETDYKEIYPVYIRKAEAQRRLDEKNVCR